MHGLPRPAGRAGPGHRGGAGDRGRGDARAGLGRAMIPEVSPGQLAALCDGRPKLILLPGVAAPEALALPGLALWVVGAGAVPLLHPLGAPADGPGIPLPAAPGQVLGIVAPEAAAAAPLLGWWREAAPAAVPPVIEAATGAAALPALAARALAALAASAEEGMAAQQGLVALRQEHEALRLAQAALRQAAAPSPAARGAAAGRRGGALGRRPCGRGEGRPARPRPGAGGEAGRPGRHRAASEGGAGRRRCRAARAPVRRRERPHRRRLGAARAGRWRPAG